MASKTPITPRKSATKAAKRPRANKPDGERADAKGGKTASQLISARIRELGDWRGEVLRHVRKLIKEAEPGITEEWKWRGTPVWSHNGGVCTGESYKEVVKLTFFKGASLKDPAALFNSSLDGNVRRAVDIREGDEIDESAFKDLIRAAVSLNLAATKDPRKAARSTTKRPAKKAAAKPVLLSGGNPQIAKADGDAPVQAYIAAMPGWKRDVGRRLDALIVRAVPNVRKAVRWNSPFYGIEGQGWFLSFHCFTKYVKVAFFRGASLRPIPPGESKDKDTRYVDLHEDDLEEAQMARWVTQASKLPGWGNA
jgi:hypothetical protein